MKKDEYLYIGFAIPQEEMNKYFKNDPFPSIQSNKFNWNIIKCLEYSKKYEIMYICATQVSNFPLYPKKYFSKKIWNVDILGKEIKILEIPYINTEILKIITRFFSVMFYGLKEILKLKNIKGIIVCDIHIPFMLSGYILSKIFKIKYIAIWTDPPALSNERESGIKNKLRKIEINIAKFLMKRVDKVIAMTKYLCQDFAPGKPYLIIEGIIDGMEVCNEKIEKNNHKTKVVYTGSLEKRYGIENIVKAFQLIEEENIILEIYGRGDYEEELKTISEVNSKIKYFGFMDNKKILSIQRNANFLINARDEKEKYTRYSFPSKMMEYMMSGTPIITTILSGFPDEYKEYLICLDNNSPENISKKILEVSKWDIEKQIYFGEKAKKFILNKTYINQGDKIINFLNLK